MVFLIGVVSFMPFLNILPLHWVLDPYSFAEMHLVLWYCYLVVGNKIKEKKVMSSNFLMFFDFIMSVANSRGKEKVTENTFLYFRGGIINKHFHLDCKKNGQFLVLTKHFSFILLVRSEMHS